jgi:hypothetical protein
MLRNGNRSRPLQGCEACVVACHAECAFPSVRPRKPPGAEFSPAPRGSLRRQFPTSKYMPVIAMTLPGDRPVCAISQRRVERPVYNVSGAHEAMPRACVSSAV